MPNSKWLPFAWLPHTKKSPEFPILFGGMTTSQIYTLILSINWQVFIQTGGNFFTENMTILQYFYAALVSAEQDTFNARVPLVRIPVNRMNLLSKYAGDIRQAPP